MEKKYKDYINQIEKRQNIATLVETIKIIGLLGQYDSPFQAGKMFGYQLDVANTLFLTSFDKLESDLIKDNFIVSLENVYNEELYKDLDELDLVDPILSKKIHDLYQKMRISIEYIQHNTDTKSINLINLLLENKKSEKVIELLVSENVSNSLKKDIIKNIISNYPRDLKKIFSTIPSSFYGYTEEKTSYIERFKELLDKNLAVLLDEPRYIEETITKIIKTKCPDYLTKCSAKDIIEFFISHNLVNINNINWNIEYEPQNTKISSAAAGYVTGNYILGEYLYSLPSNKEIEEEIKKASDDAILEYLIKNDNMLNFKEFIENINYESTPEKLNQITKLILKNHVKKPNLLDQNRLSEIIDILLRKTKKEDYRAMKKAIIDMKANTDMNKLNKEKQEFTRRLKIISNSLLENYPATRKVGDLQLINQSKNTK